MQSNHLKILISLFKGCFEDHWVRDLDGAYASNFAENTPQNCIKICSSYLFKYSGVQHGFNRFLF